MDVYINNFINTKSYRKFEDISNKNLIVQWYCCDCGQSYGTIIYHDHIVDLLNKEDDVSRLKYYSSIIYNHPLLNSNYQLLSSLTPDFLERKFFDDEDLEYFGMQRSNSINLPINNQKHDSKPEKLLEFNTSLTHRNSICTEENNNSSISQGSPSNQNDFDHVQSCYNETEETINLNSPVENGTPYNDDNDKKDPNQYLISTPERFVCNRCSHMMCPYCPKLRCKDLS